MRIGNSGAEGLTNLANNILHQLVKERVVHPDEYQQLAVLTYYRIAQEWKEPFASNPWFGDFLHYMARRRLDSDGELESIRPADWLVLRDRLREVVRDTTTEDTFYLRILRHFGHE